MAESDRRGGVIGGIGYKFQEAYVVTMLPRWLADKAFRSFLMEGREDIDVQYKQGRKTWSDLYQLKANQVSLGDLRVILRHFVEGHRDAPVNVRSFVLGCCGLAAKVRGLWRLIEEFRGAREADSERTLKPTRCDLNRIVKSLGLAKYGELLVDKLRIDFETAGLTETVPCVLLERFRGRMAELKLCGGAPVAVLDRLFDRLSSRFGRAVRVGQKRQDLKRLIAVELAGATSERASVVYLHGWEKQRYGLPAHYELDWTAHFHRSPRRVAPPEVWESLLLPQLSELRSRMNRRRARRTIWLRSKAPLSAGLAFGHEFSEGAGFVVSTEQQTAGTVRQWHMRKDSARSEGKVRARRVMGNARNEEVLVGIGITGDPQPRISRLLATGGLRVRAGAYLSAPAERVDERNAGSIALSLKREMGRFAQRHGARLIHLFYYGPLGLAVVLGQLLNGLPPIQCYEIGPEEGYVPTCLLRG